MGPERRHRRRPRDDLPWWRCAGGPGRARPSGRPAAGASDLEPGADGALGSPGPGRLPRPSWPRRLRRVRREDALAARGTIDPAVVDQRPRPARRGTPVEPCRCRPRRASPEPTRGDAAPRRSRPPRDLRRARRLRPDPGAAAPSRRPAVPQPDGRPGRQPTNRPLRPAQHLHPQVVVTEGAIDALSANAAGYRAVAVLSAAYPDREVALALARLPHPLVIAFDADRAGRAGAHTWPSCWSPSTAHPWFSTSVQRYERRRSAFGWT